MIATVTLEAYLVKVKMSNYMNQEENRTGHIQVWLLWLSKSTQQPAPGWIPGIGLHRMLFSAFSTLTQVYVEMKSFRRPSGRLPVDILTAL